MHFLFIIFFPILFVYNLFSNNLIYIFHAVNEKCFCSIIHNYSFQFNINYIERTDIKIIITAKTKRGGDGE